ISRGAAHRPERCARAHPTPPPLCGGDHSRNTELALLRWLAERDQRRIRACHPRRNWTTVRRRPDSPSRSVQELDPIDIIGAAARFAIGWRAMRTALARISHERT